MKIDIDALERLAERTKGECIPACYSCDKCECARDFVRNAAPLLLAAARLAEAFEDCAWSECDPADQQMNPSNRYALSALAAYLALRDGGGE